ncbi:MAG: hypothetical protein EPN93_04755 [Spirochaetes bacterium]|nr:MAG: hypothetical protein EPN93_04755 [Spirochaetota bacterium]
MKTRARFVVLPLGLLAALTLRADPGRLDATQWARIEIKEAFISRQTSIDFADAASAPEFGWHLYAGDDFIMRADRIYAVMYAPQYQGIPIRLVLVECDIVFDDIVSGTDLIAGVSRYTLNPRGDFTVIERTAFFPEKASGPDSDQKGSVPVSADTTGSVSFIDGDYTDWFRFADGITAALVVTDSRPGIIDAPVESDAKAFDGERSFGTVHILSITKPGTPVRIRGPIGGGKLEYRVLPVRGADRFGALFGRAMRLLEGESESASIFIVDDMAKAFLEYDAAATRARCAEATGAAAGSNVRKFCAAVAEADSWGR